MWGNRVIMTLSITCISTHNIYRSFRVHIFIMSIIRSYIANIFINSCIPLIIMNMSLKNNVHSIIIKQILAIVLKNISILKTFTILIRIIRKSIISATVTIQMSHHYNPWKNISVFLSFFQIFYKPVLLSF